eukprot:160933-Rhodomonas_salina.1
MHESARRQASVCVPDQDGSDAAGALANGEESASNNELAISFGELTSEDWFEDVFDQDVANSG